MYFKIYIPKYILFAPKVRVYWNLTGYVKPGSVRVNWSDWCRLWKKVDYNKLGLDPKVRTIRIWEESHTRNERSVE